MQLWGKPFLPGSTGLGLLEPNSGFVHPPCVGVPGGPWGQLLPEAAQRELTSPAWKS